MFTSYIAYRSGEVTGRVGALVDILAGGQVPELLVLSTADDVGSNEPVSLVAADTRAVREVVGLGLVLDDAVLDLGEVEAANPGAGWDHARPRPVGLAEQGRQARPLVSRVTLVPR